MPGHTPYLDRYNRELHIRERCCRKCEEWQPIANYELHTTGLRRRVCKDCKAEDKSFSDYRRRPPAPQMYWIPKREQS